MLSQFCIRRPIFATVLSIIIVLAGLIALRVLPLSQYPDISPPTVRISTTYDGADAETVNNAVATPVAQSVMGVSDMLYLQTEATATCRFPASLTSAPTPTTPCSKSTTASARPNADCQTSCAIRA